MQKFTDKSIQELQNIFITQTNYNSVDTVGFILSDGQYCRVGRNEFTGSHTFDKTKKITKIESVINFNEFRIIQIKFYSGTELLVKLGWSDDQKVKQYTGRVESFEIG